MFRRLDGFVNNVWSTYQEDQAQLATTPIMVSSIAPPSNLNEATRGITPGSTIDIYSPANAYYSQITQLNQKNTQCLTKTSPQAIIDTNPSGPLQCGWYYNTSSRTGQSYLSTRKGPILGLNAPPPTQPYTLYFGNNPGNMLTSLSKDLQSAQMQMDIDNCNHMACNQLGSAQYKDCAWCGTKGIPVKNGLVKYPQNILATCAGGSANLITSSQQCPPPPPIANPNSQVTTNSQGIPTGIVRPDVAPTAGQCMPDSTGRLSGACLQTALSSQGCSPQGSMSLALNGFTSTTEVDSIKTNNSRIGDYFNTTPKPAFDLNKFTMAPTMADAQSQALALATASQLAKTSGQPTKQNTLAIDMCKQSGYFIDNYDFCTELIDTSPLPTAGWDLNCLQKAFLAAGLTSGGSMYPTKYNSAYAFYNTLSPWKAVKDYMKNIYDGIYNGCDIAEGFTVRERFENPMSNPFTLQSVNYPALSMTFADQGSQIRITNIPTQFVWQKGSQGTIMIFPAAQSSFALALRGSRLYANPLPSQNNTFYVRNGNSGGNSISFESATQRGSFLRHSGFALYMGPNENTPLYNADSSFVPKDTAGSVLPLSFFRSITGSSNKPNLQVCYPGQSEAVKKGWGQILDVPVLAFTTEGMEIYTTSTINSGDGNMAVITDYRVASSPPNLPNLERNHILVNLTTSTDQVITPKLTVQGPVNLFCYTVNSVLTAWGWQSDNLIDAEPNTFQPLQILKSYKKQTKNMRIALYNKPGTTLLKPFQLFANQPNIFKAQWVTGGTGAPMYSFPMSPEPTMSILRDINAPFLRFEVLNDPVLTANPIFTDRRAAELMFSNTVLGNPLQFKNTGLNILKTPGVNGYAQFNGSQMTNIQIDYPIWGYATFAFSITSIPSTTVEQAINLLHIGNKIDGQIGNGFRCAVYGSTNGNITLTIQTLSQTGAVAKSSAVTVPLQVGSWYMLGIQSATITNNPTVTVYAINPQTQTTSVTGTPILLDSSIQIKQANHSQRTGPYFQIGDANASIDFNVAWLHFFDNTISTADPNTEVAGYGPRGYQTGLF